MVASTKIVRRVDEAAADGIWMFLPGALGGHVGPCRIETQEVARSIRPHNSLARLSC